MQSLMRKRIKTFSLIMIPGAALLLHAPAYAAQSQGATGAVVVAEPPATKPSSASTTLYSSSLWSGGSGKTSGLWTISEDSDHHRTLRFDDSFRSKDTDGLELFLSPLEAGALKNKHATNDAVRIATLNDKPSARSYAIPDSIDLSRFRTLMIYDTGRSKIVAVSSLSRGTVIAASDQWKKKTKSTKGAYEIVRRGDELFIRFSEDFKTAKPPEPLRVLFSPASVDSTNNKNAEDNAFFVAVLRTYKGGQEYRINGAGDLNRYRSVLLNCKKYTKLWSAARLDLRN